MSGVWCFHGKGRPDLPSLRRLEHEFVSTMFRLQDCVFDLRHDLSKVWRRISQLLALRILPEAESANVA
jgi:hypothetical protein